jgi:hypothetical protein
MSAQQDTALTGLHLIQNHLPLMNPDIEALELTGQQIHPIQNSRGITVNMATDV